MRERRVACSRSTWSSDLARLSSRVGRGRPASAASAREALEHRRAGLGSAVRRDPGPCGSARVLPVRLIAGLAGWGLPLVRGAGRVAPGPPLGEPSGRALRGDSGRDSGAGAPAARAAGSAHARSEPMLSRAVFSTNWATTAARVSSIAWRRTRLRTLPSTLSWSMNWRLVTWSSRSRAAARRSS